MTTEFNLDSIDLAGVVEVPISATAVEEKPAKSARRTTSKQTLIFDLETVPDESRMEKFGLEPLPVARRTNAFFQMPGGPDLRICGRHKEGTTKIQSR